jgi:hypothetical protein
VIIKVEFVRTRKNGKSAVERVVMTEWNPGQIRRGVNPIDKN